MELMTKTIERNLPDLYTTEDVPLAEKKVVVKYFNPCGAATWYIVEGRKENFEGGDPDVQDWLLFGWCDLGFGPGYSELGYVTLGELRELKLPMGLGIERDLHLGNKVLGDLIDC